MSENDRHRPFSEREGFTQPPALQINSMDDELRTCLWNDFYNFLNRFELKDSSILGGPPKPAQRAAAHRCLRLWVDFFNQSEDQFPILNISGSFSSLFRRIEWYRVYDLIEFILENDTSIQAEFFGRACERCLKKHNSDHRIRGKKVVPITSEQEFSEIYSAMNSAHPSPRDHIRSAFSLFADRPTPDYPNSIKESISAVESLAKIVTGKEKATLGKLTRELGELPRALRQALSNFYGYASDEPGIRHGRSKNPTRIRREDAHFMLVVCSAFVNYIEAKYPIDSA